MNNLCQFEVSYFFFFLHTTNLQLCKYGFKVANVSIASCDTWVVVHLKWHSSLKLVETLTNKSDYQSHIVLRMQFHFYNPTIQPLLFVFFAVGKDKASFKNEITQSKMKFSLSKQWIEFATRFEQHV